MLDSRQLSPAGGTHAAAPMSREQLDDVHLLDRLATVFKHGRLIGAAFVVVVAIAMLESYSATPQYRTTVRIVIQEERAASIAALESAESNYWQDVELYLNTQYRILASRGLARRVVRRLPPPPAPAAGTLVRAITLPRRLLGSLQGPRGAVPEEAPAADATPAEMAAAEAFLGGLQIQPVKGTRIVEIAYSAPDAAYAALAANTLAREYVQQNLELRVANTAGTVDWLSEEIGKQRKKVEAAERAMAEFQEHQNAMSLDDRQNIVLARLHSLNEAVTRAKTARLQKETTYRQLGTNPDLRLADNYPAVAQSPSLQEMKQQLANLQGEKARLSQRYGANHPEMEKIAKQIDGASARLRAETARVLESIANEYRSALTEEQSLGSLLEDQKRLAIDLNRKNIDYSILQREAESERQVYNALLQQEKELRVISNSRANNVQVMDEADVPGAPYTPNHGRDWMMALVLGLAVGVGLAYAVEYFDDTVKLPLDVTRRLGLPMLGLVPAVPGDKLPLLLDGEAPYDFGEAFRSLRTSLVFVHGAERRRLLAVTSTQPLEGKTTTACNLALVLAAGGGRVLLVDADMRRPCLHRTLGLPNEVGLSQVLSGQAEVREALQNRDDRLAVITAGAVPGDPSELLSSPRMRQFIANLKRRPFDWIIFDTPPVLPVTDAVIVAPHMSGIVFVIGADKTRRPHADRAIETLRTGSPKSIGAVLNQVDVSRNKYYYSRYYGYHYKSYYGDGASPAA